MGLVGISIRKGTVKAIIAIHGIRAVGIVGVISSEERTEILELHLELRDCCGDGLERGWEGSCWGLGDCNTATQRQRQSYHGRGKEGRLTIKVLNGMKKRLERDIIRYIVLH